MNTVRKDVDALNIILTIKVSKEDYSEKVEKTLKDYRRKANIPGFRVGKVPMSMIQKQYGITAKADEVNRLLTDELNRYITDNKLDIIGEPLPNDELTPKIEDWNTAEDFEFAFDAALSPAIDLTLSKRNSIKYYNVKIDEAQIDKEVQNYASRFGSYEQVDVAEEKDMLKGLAVELNEDGSEKENGIRVEGAVIMPAYIKAEDEKAKFVGAKKNSVLVFNPNKAYENNLPEIASLLNIDKTKAAEVTSDFNFEIADITRHKDSAIDQSLFDKVFGEGTMKSEEEFRAKIKAALQETYAPDSDYKFSLDVKEYIVEKLKNLELPEPFLKRLLLATNEKMTQEYLEENFDKILEDLKWQLFSGKVIKEQDLKIELEDLKAQARTQAKMQFAQYGMSSVPEDVINNYVDDMMKKQEHTRQLSETAMNAKIIDYLKKTIKLNEEEISIDDFNKLFADAAPETAEESQIEDAKIAE